MATRKFDFTPPPVRNRKHKAAAKERRRIIRAKLADKDKSPLELGEEIPPFFIPARYKLIFKYLQAQKNSRRLQRKELPVAKKEELAERAEAHG